MAALLYESGNEAMKTKTWRDLAGGWRLLLAGFLMAGVSVGINLNCNTVLLEPVCRGLGIRVTTFSLATSLNTLASIPCYLLLPELLKRVPARRVIFGSGVAFAEFRLLSGLSGNALMLCLSAVGTGLAASGLSYIVINTLLNRRFTRGRGTAAGVAAAGAGLVGAAMVPAVTALTASLG